MLTWQPGMSDGGTGTPVLCGAGDSGQPAVACGESWALFCLRAKAPSFVAYLLIQRVLVGK